MDNIGVRFWTFIIRYPFFVLTDLSRQSNNQKGAFSIF
jgi:hypothetical protein